MEENKEKQNKEEYETLKELNQKIILFKKDSEEKDKKDNNQTIRR